MMTVVSGSEDLLLFFCCNIGYSEPSFHNSICFNDVAIKNEFAVVKNP